MENTHLNAVTKEDRLAIAYLMESGSPKKGNRQLQKFNKGKQQSNISKSTHFV
jgi:hypothetical protein